MDSYLTQADADVMAAQMLSTEVAAYLAASGTATAPALTDREKALLAATRAIDAAMRYQGRRWDPTGFITGTPQVLEFPRVAYQGSFTPWMGYGGIWPDASWPGYPGFSGTVIWDWDGTNKVAVVPDDVKRATLFEANSLLLGNRKERTDARHDGVTSQSGDGLAEAYAGDCPILCAAAHQIMVKYRLRSGEMR